MPAFAAAINALFADPNIAREAIWRAGGEGEGTSVRIVWRSPDQVTDFGGGRFVSRGRFLDVRISECGGLAAGDTFEIDGATYAVQGEPLRDDEGLIWATEVHET